MRTTCLTCAVLLLATGAAGAETLYNQDGVQLSATARVIDPGGATCRVREERHSAEEYEKLKPNHSQPLNVWRVELVVANYSGKVLDYLSAHLNVESVWPPCDNWDGLGNYGKQVVWTGPLMTIQDVGSVEPGEERREIEFVLAWHEDDPVLGRWDIDYDFADGAAGSETAQETASAPSGTARTAGGFQPDETCADKESVSYTDNHDGVPYPTCWMEIENYPRCYFWNDQWKLTKTTATTRPARTGKPVPLLLSPEVLPHRPPAGLLCLGVADHHAGVLPAAGDRHGRGGRSALDEGLRAADPAAVSRGSLDAGRGGPLAHDGAHRVGGQRRVSGDGPVRVTRRKSGPS